MELSDLRLFQRVAQEQSISRAAAALHIAQPTVSQRLQALEAEVERPLFTRHRRGVTLTPGGEAFLSHVERALALISQGVEATRSTGGVVQINLAAPASINGYYLPPLLRQLVEAGCDVTVHDAHSAQVMQMVLDGTIHAGFLLGGPGHPGVRRHLVHRDPILCVAAADHPLAGRTELTLADLAGCRLALYAFSAEFEAFRTAVERASGSPLRGMLKVTPAEAARSLALGGAFITFLPAMTVAGDLAAGRLIALPVPDLPAYAWEISVVYRERKVQTRETAALLEALGLDSVAVK